MVGVRLIEVGGRKRRDERRAVAGHDRRGFVVEEDAVLDAVDAGARRVLTMPRMDSSVAASGQASGVRSLDPGPNLGLRVLSGHQVEPSMWTPPVTMIAIGVRAMRRRRPGRRPDLVGAIRVGSQVLAVAIARGDDEAGREDARPVDEPLGDGIAHREDTRSGAQVAHRRDAVAKVLLGEPDHPGDQPLRRDRAKGLVRAGARR